MVTGHPDWQTWAGRSAGGGDITSETDFESIISEATTNIDFAVVPAGKRYILQNIMLECPTNSFLHGAIVQIPDRLLSLLFTTFSEFKDLNFAGFTVDAGETVRVRITNNGTANLTFHATMFYTEIDV